jgi:hypothetical protein
VRDRTISHRIARLVPLLLVVAAPAAGGGVNPAQVAFKQFPGGGQAIVRLDQTGGNPVELTSGKPVPSEFGAFSWSPDGSQLVYASQGVAGGDLYAVDVGCDRVEVDEDGGPDGLERRFASPEVAALAPSVAVDDEPEQPLDSRPGALEMVALGGVG